MELTRTERLILETAAGLVQFEIGAARAATLTTLELTTAELEAAGGGRPQLGDVMVGRGWLSQEQLEQVLDCVFSEVQGWSERLAAPKPKPVPRPLETPDHDAQLAELVQQLTGLLDVLVAGGSGDATVIRRVVATYSEEEESPISASAFPSPGRTQVAIEDEDEDEDTKDIPPLSARPAATAPGREEASPLEGGAPAFANDLDAPTLSRERVAGSRGPDSGQDERESPTLHVERPAARDDDTVHLEREAISPNASGVEFTWSPPKDDDTVHLERPAGGAVHAERSVISTGDTVIVEGTSPGNPSR